MKLKFITVAEWKLLVSAFYYNIIEHCHKWRNTVQNWLTNMNNGLLVVQSQRWSQIKYICHERVSDVGDHVARQRMISEVVLKHKEADYLVIPSLPLLCSTYQREYTYIMPPVSYTAMLQVMRDSTELQVPNHRRSFKLSDISLGLRHIYQNYKSSLTDIGKKKNLASKATYVYAPGKGWK